MKQPLIIRSKKDIPDNMSLGTPYIIDIFPANPDDMLDNIEELLIKRNKLDNLVNKSFVSNQQNTSNTSTNNNSSSSSTHHSSSSSSSNSSTTSGENNNQHIPKIYWGKAKNVNIGKGEFTKKYKTKAFDAYAHIHQTVRNIDEETLLPIETLEFQINTINSAIVVGLNNDPENKDDYKDIKYGLYFWKNVIYLFNENNEGKFGTWKTSDTFYFEVTENTVIIKQNNIEIITYDRDDNSILYFDNVIYMTENSGLINIKANGHTVEVLSL